MSLQRNDHPSSPSNKDFGAHWMHDAVVEKVWDGESGAEVPAIADGAGRVPPQDVGAAVGFIAFWSQRSARFM